MAGYLTSIQVILCTYLVLVGTVVRPTGDSYMFEVYPNDAGFAMGLESCLQFNTKAALDSIMVSEMSDWKFHSDILTYVRNGPIATEYIIKVQQSFGFMIEHMILLQDGPRQAFSFDIPVITKGVLHGATKGSYIAFSSACGTYNYGGLKVTDLSGNVVPSIMIWNEEEHLLSLRIGKEGEELTYPILIDPFANNPKWSSVGYQNNTAFGHAIGFGDFNGDTWLDIIVTDPLESPPAYPFAGTFRIWYNDAAGTTTFQTPLMYTNENPDSNFGFAMSIGRADSNAVDDVMIGAPRKHDGGLPDPATDSSSSASNWMRGGAYRYIGVLNSGLGTKIGGYFPVGGGSTGGRFYTGSAVHIGSLLNPNDGLVGCPLWSNYEVSPEGYVVALPEGTGKVYAGFYNFMGDGSAPAPYKNASLANDVLFGTSLTTGKFDEDTIGDAVIGAPRATRPGGYTTNTGAIFVYLGKTLNNAAFTGTDGKLPSQVIWGPQSAALFGKVIMSMGDLTGDNKEELLVTAPSYNDDTGRVYIYKGQSSTLGGVVGTNGINTTNVFYLEGPSTYSMFGWSVAILKEGGRKDLLVGAPGYGEDKRGAVFLFKQNPVSLGGMYNSTPSFVVEGKPGERFGWKVESADINKDGYGDMLVTSESYALSGTRRGKVELYLGMPVSDLTVEATSNPSGLTVIGTVTEATITAVCKNLGPAFEKNMTCAIRMPSALPIVDITWTAGTANCTESERLVSCRVGGAVGTTYTLVLRLNIAAAQMGEYLFAVTNTGENYDPTPAITTIGFKLAAVANIALTGTLNGTTTNVTSVIAGQYLRYVYTVSNPTGPSPAYGVTLSTVLPSSVTVESMTVSTGGQCLGSLTCDVGTIPWTGSATVTLEVRVKPSTTSTSISFAMVASTASTDTDLSNNYLTYVTEVTQSADVDVTIMASPVKAYAGEGMYFTVPITNLGPSDTTNVVFNISIPAPFVYTSHSIDVTGATCVRTGAFIKCNITRIVGGERAVLAVVGSIPSNTTATDMTVIANAGHQTSDPSSANNMNVQVIYPVTKRCNVAINIFGYPTIVDRNKFVTWTLTGMNRGPADATGVMVRVLLPVSNSFASLVLDPPTISKTSQNPNNMTFSLGAIKANDYYSFTIKYNVTTAVSANPMVMSAYIYGSFDSDFLANVKATASVAIKTGANLQGVMSVYPNPPISGKTTTTSFTIVNSGPDPATGVVARIYVPPGLSVATLPSLPNWMCSLASPYVECSLTTGSISTTDQITINTVFDVPSSYIGSVTMSGVVVPGAQADVDLTNNNKTVVYTVRNEGSLNIAMLASPDQVSGGQEVTYTVSYGNGGPGDAHNVYIFFNYSSELTVKSWSTSNGTCANVTGGFRCNVSDVVVGARGSIIIKANVLNTMSNGVVSMSAIVYSNADYDRTTDNIVTRNTIVQVPNADLALVATCTVNSSVGLNYIPGIVIFNAGPAVSRPFVNITVPVGLTFKESTLLCNISGSTLKCMSPVELQPLGSLTVSLTFTTVGATTGVKTISYTLSGSVEDYVPANNVASCTTDFVVERSVDLVMNVVAQESTSYMQSASFTVQVINGGPGVAQSLQTDITIPNPSKAVLPAVTPISIIPNNGSCSLITSTKYRCVLPVLDVGLQISYQMKFTVLTELAEPLTVSGTVTSDNTENAVATNTASDTCNVVIKADVQLMLTASHATAYYLNTVSMASSIINMGPSIAKTATYTLTYDHLLLKYMSAPGCTVVETTGTISCPITRIDPRAKTGFVAKFNVTSQNIGDADFHGSVTLANDPDLLNNVGDQTIELGLMSDMYLAITGNHLTVYPGTVMSTSLFLQNRGPTKASNVYLECTRGSANYIFDTISGTKASGCTLTASKIFCSWTEFDRLVDASFYIKSNISVTATGIAAVICFSNSSSFDPNPSNNNRTVFQVPVLGHADLDLVVTPLRNYVTIGATVDFSISLVNSGPATSRNVLLTMTLDSLFTFVSTSNPVYCTHDAGVVTCNMRDLSSGFGSNIIVKVQVKAGGTATKLHFIAVVTSDTEDIIPENNDADMTITRGIACDAEVALLVAPMPLPLGEYAMVYVNVVNKESVATEASLKFYVPTMFTVVSVPPTCTAGYGIVTCSLPTLTQGLTVTRAIRVQLGVTSDEYVPLIAEVQTETPDVDEFNNYIEMNVNVSRSADIILSASTSPVASPFPRGSIQKWDFRVYNRGPAASLGNNVTITMDQKLEILTMNSTCLRDDVAKTYICPVGVVRRGSDAKIFVLTRIPTTASDELSCFAKLIDIPYDPVTVENNNVTVNRTIGTSCDVYVRSIATGKTYSHEPFNLRVELDNKGKAVAVNSTVLVIPGDGLTITYAPGCTRGVEPGSFNCTIPEVLAGIKTEVSFLAVAYRNTTVFAKVEASPYSPDSNVSNNNITVNIVLGIPSADVQVTTELVDEVGDTIPTGTILQHLFGYLRFNLKNKGPNSAHHVLLSIDADLGISLNIKNFTIPGCYLPTASNNIARCNITMLDAKDSMEVDVGVVFDVAGELGYVYNLTHLFGDKDPTNNNGNSTAKVVQAVVRPKPYIVTEGDSSSTVQEIGIGAGVLVVAGAVAVKMGLFKRKRPVKKDDGIVDHLEEMERMDGVTNLNEEEEAAMEDAGDIWVDKSEVTLETNVSSDTNTLR